MSLEESLVADGWKTPDTYDPCFAVLPNSPAVYIVAAVDLWAENGATFEIAYVGMSRNVCKRLDSTHEAVVKIDGEGLWPKRFFKTCDERELRSVERGLIRLHQPRLNIIGKADPLQ